VLASPIELSGLDLCLVSTTFVRNWAAGMNYRSAGFFAKQGMWVTGNSMGNKINISPFLYRKEKLFSCVQEIS
jgi:hypothetical protein